MNKTQFVRLFRNALEAAAQNAEQKLHRPIPRTFLVKLHAPRQAGNELSFGHAADELYLGDDRFYRIIDVSVTEITSGKTHVFVRVSGHEPAEFSKTWDPSGLGPFKQIIAENIRVH